MAHEDSNHELAVIRQESDEITREILECLGLPNASNLTCFTIETSTSSPTLTPPVSPDACKNQSTPMYSQMSTLNTEKRLYDRPIAVINTNTIRSEPKDKTITKIRKFTIRQENLTAYQPHEIDGRLYIGPNGTSIETTKIDEIKWHNCSFAVRKMLRLFFSRHVLATHTLSGKPSPG